MKSITPRTKPHLVTLILLASLSAFASNVFLPSLPHMADDFGTTTGVMGLSVGVFFAASAVYQIIAGPVSDNIGRRPVLLFALVVFTVASLGCAYAPSVEAFLTLRAIQAASAIAMALARAVVRDTVPADRAGSQIAYVTMGMSVVPMLSPAVGGLLETHLGWQATFLLCAGVGFGLLVLTYHDLGETAPDMGRPIGQQFAGYGALLRSPRFWGYSMAAALGSGAFFSYLGGAPYVGRVVFGLSAQELGFVFGAPAVGYFFGNFTSGRFSARAGIHPMILGGLLITSSGAGLSLLIGVLGYDSPISFFGGMIIIAFGNGMTIPNATAGMLSVRPNLAGTASGLGAAMMIAGGAALSAFAGFILEGSATALPLLSLQFASSLAGMAVILMVLRRNRRLGL